MSLKQLFTKEGKKSENKNNKYEEKINDFVVSNSKKNCPRKLDSSQSSPLLFVKALIKHINVMMICRTIWISLMSCTFIILSIVVVFLMIYSTESTDLYLYHDLTIILIAFSVFCLLEVMAVSLCITYYIPQLDEVDEVDKVDETKEADANKLKQSKSGDKKKSNKKSKLERKSTQNKDMHILVNEMFKSTSGFLKKYYSYYNGEANEKNEFLCITVILVTTILIACEITILQRKLLTENFMEKENPSKDNDQILKRYQKNIVNLLRTINSYMNTITDDAGSIIKFKPSYAIAGDADSIRFFKYYRPIYSPDHKKLNSPFLNLKEIFNTISTEKAHGSDDSYNIDLIGLYHDIVYKIVTNLTIEDDQSELTIEDDQSEPSIEDNKSETPLIERTLLNDLIYEMDKKITEYSKSAIEKNKVEDIDLDNLEKKIGSVLLGIIDMITEIRTHKGFQDNDNLQKYIDDLRTQSSLNWFDIMEKRR
ncbi:7965_t:CDS:2 [Racocetra fulgida]|uniref:7965_t:CDS:1 n=1 Tax=Racocetra fulgida TaxID=60492 RepID=A0A9N9AS64_9GLOM|nr:7965_t:CDS:2 [Racocetra fulgida]